MSLASDYAAAVAAAAGDVVTAAATAPAPLTGPNGHLEVTPQGNLRAVPGPGVGAVEIPAAAVPAAIAWLTTNFV
ncbi:MAG TPA: hypothetical protein VGQ44_17380 [Gemmatimonadaceae bacterium]|nr:hypothetical protein [Gemmatimonadaceae bacterium]